MFNFSTSVPKVLLITIVSTFLALCIPYQTGATNDVLNNDQQQAETNLIAGKEAVEAFYQAITTQNFGIAEKIYTIPPLGTKSNDPELKDFNTPSDYLQSLYPSERYIINDFTILSFNKTDDENSYHALVQLKGNVIDVDSEDSLIAYTQDVLVYRDSNENWKVSIERFISFQHLMLESKPLDELSDREKIYRFFLEMDMNNYGAAANLISTDMPGLKDDSKESISLYLKDYRAEQVKNGVDRVSSINFHILNAFGSGESSTIYKVSSKPYQNENLSAIQYIRIKNENGQSLINELNVVAGLVQQNNSTQSSMTRLWDLLKGNPYFVCWVISLSISIGALLILTFRRKREIRRIRGEYLGIQRVMREYQQRTARNNATTVSMDIETSVDLLLNSIEVNDTQELKEDVNSSRKVYIEHSTENEGSTKTESPKGSERKLYVD